MVYCMAAEMVVMHLLKRNYNTVTKLLKKPLSIDSRFYHLQFVDYYYYCYFYYCYYYYYYYYHHHSNIFLQNEFVKKMYQLHQTQQHYLK